MACPAHTLRFVGLWGPVPDTIQLQSFLDIRIMDIRIMKEYTPIQHLKEPAMELSPGAL
jgi:hypothetical protein